MMHFGISHNLVHGLQKVLEKTGDFESSDPKEVSQYMRMLASNCQTIWDRRTEYQNKDGDVRYVGILQLIMYGNTSTDLARYVIYRETIKMPPNIEEEHDLDDVEIICREIKECGPEEFLERAVEFDRAMTEEFEMFSSSDLSA